MRLLLLLSMLLSALTGVGANARVPDVAQAVAGQSAAAEATAPAERAARVLPPVALPSLKALAVFAAPPSVAPEAAPLWTNRRRE